MTQDVAPSLGPPPDIRKRMALVFGEENMQAMELAHLLRVVVQLMRNLSAESGRTTQLSPSRLRLLVHLLIAREYGYDSLAPSDLSRHLAVSRNTISALLNGLEEQGYIVPLAAPRRSPPVLRADHPGGHGVGARGRAAAWRAGDQHVRAAERRRTRPAHADHGPAGGLAGRARGCIGAA